MTESVTSKRSYWLIASLILNALLLGVIIGGGIAKQRGAHSGGPFPPTEFGLVRGLDESMAAKDRRAVRGKFRAAFMQSKPQREAIVQARGALEAALIADPYDADAVRAAFAALTEAEVKMKSALHETLVTEMEELTPEQRQAVIRAQRRQGMRGQRGGPPGKNRQRQGRPD